MLRQRRTKLEVYLDVLWVIKSGTKKPTRIMYGANLSWKPLQRILASLVSQELIRLVDTTEGRDKRTKSHYELTQKGENVIRYFNQAKELLDLDEIKHI